MVFRGDAYDLAKETFPYVAPLFADLGYGMTEFNQGIDDFKVDSHLHLSKEQAEADPIIDFLKESAAFYEDGRIPVELEYRTDSILTLYPTAHFVIRVEGAKGYWVIKNPHAWTAQRMIPNRAVLLAPNWRIVEMPEKILKKTNRGTVNEPVWDMPLTDPYLRVLFRNRAGEVKISMWEGWAAEMKVKTALMRALERLSKLEG